MTNTWYALAPDGTRKDLASLGGPMRLLVGAPDSGGGLSLMEQRLDGPGGPPLHVHDDSDEFLLVVEGGPLTVQVGERRLELARGGLVWLPRGTPHTFSNLSGAPLVLLGGASPGGIERALHEQAVYFQTLAPGARPDLAAVAEIWGAQGRIVGPPLPPSSSGIHPTRSS